MDIARQILLVVVSLDRNMHRHMAWCLLSLLDLPVPPAAPALCWWGRSSAWGAGGSAMLMSCSEVTVPLFILPLWIVGSSLLVGLSPHTQASGGGREWEQHAGSTGSPSISWLLLYSLPLLSSSSLIFPSSLMPELLKQVNTVEKFHVFNPLLFCVSVLVECGSEKLLMSSTQDITFTSCSLILVCSLTMDAEKQFAVTGTAFMLLVTLHLRGVFAAWTERRLW